MTVADGGLSIAGPAAVAVIGALDGVASAAVAVELVGAGGGVAVASRSSTTDVATIKGKEATGDCC